MKAYNNPDLEPSVREKEYTRTPDCINWSSVTVKCSHQSKTRSLPIACGDIDNCEYCWNRRYKKIWHRIRSGYDPTTGNYHLLTITNERSHIGAQELSLQWNKFRRKFEYALWKFYHKPRSLLWDIESRRLLRLQSHSYRDITCWEWFRVVEQSTGGKEYTSASGQKALTRGHVHMHVLMRNYPLKDYHMGDKPLWVFEQDNIFDPFYREIRKILKQCNLGPVFDITKERHPNGASSYIAKYLNKTTKSIKDPETERRVRHYDSSIGWNLDRHPKPSRWAKQKYHRGVIADDRFDVNCDCDHHLDDPAWYMREWQKKVKGDPVLEKHLEYVLETDKELPKTLQLENKGLLRELPLPVIKVAHKLYKEGKTWV